MKISPRIFNQLVSPFVARVRSGTKYLFEKQLLLTNIGLSVTISGTGDCIQQNYEKYKSPERKYDLRRTFNMSMSGATIGVFCHYWYIWLDKFLIGKTFKVAAKKVYSIHTITLNCVLIDQIVCSPVTIGIFFVTMAVLEKSSADEFLLELRSKSWRLYLAEWIIWPPAQLINFLFLPLRYRVLYDNTISTCYDVYTSYVKHEIPVDCEPLKVDYSSNDSKTNQLSSSLSEHHAITL